MLERDLIRALRRLAEPQVKPVSAARDSVSAQPRAFPGPRFLARVEAALPDGVYRVNLAGQILHFTLPAAVRPGDTLELVHTGNPERPGFTPAPPEEPARATLSETGRLLSALAHPRPANPSIMATASRPLLTGPPINAGDLGSRLHQALSRSGLFYESHQAEWVAGNRPLLDLFQEPQGRLSPAIANGRHSSFEAQTSAWPLEADAAQVPARLENTGPVDEQTVPLVRQQLDALELRQIQWRGEIWPGQWMDWGIEEQPPRDDVEPAGGRQWQTHLRLTLPRLGEISATLTIASEGLTLALEANQTSEPILRSGGPLLREALQAAGLPVLGWTVGVYAGV